ncbi:MAG: GxxExxY protein [Parcubacteria group bacterium]|nr:GxxExxY protein [Parcubacteria group bacterium]
MLLPDQLNQPLETQAGIGPRVWPRLQRLGIKRLGDFLTHLPFRYEDFSNIKKIADLTAGEKTTITAKILNTGNKRTWKRKMNITEALLEDQTAPIRAVWFNQPYLTQTLKKGLWINISGKVSLDNMGLYFSNPVFEVLGSEVSERETLHTAGLVPIYPETEGLTSRWLRLKIKGLLDNLPPLADFLPPLIIKEFRLISLDQALRQVHFPKNPKESTEAKRRLSFQDIFLLQLYAHNERQKIKSKSAAALPIDLALIKRFIASLPFQLTNSQKLAAWQILKDLEQNSPMNRILIGEVGSGKTVVAAIAALNTASQGYQTAFLAPTEILAQQHFKTISRLFANQPIDVALLTSSQAELGHHQDHPPISKKELTKKIAEGQIHIVIGTHALIQKEVRFGKLGLVIVDEQHRFGVDQRAALLRDHIRDPNNPNISESPKQKPPEKIVEKELSYRLTGLFFQIQDRQGRFCREKQYADALAEKLAANNIRFQREVPIEIAGIRSNIIDFIVEDKIIIELKTKSFLDKNDYYQVARYLESANRELGLLVNFRQSHLKPKRILNPKVTSQNQFGTFGSRSGRSDRFIPHLLSLSATPIPRTLALTLYGDLDLSTLRELPQGRKKIITKIVAPANRERAYEFIEKQIKMGRQAFVICPLIEESQALIMNEVKAATKEYEKLSKEIFPHLKIGLLHGRMKSKDKEKVMKEFKDGELDVVVSTSVVEVGIDVPNASVMMIEGADRFGLSQLHQFRGRVGRAEHQSYCFLFTEAEGRTANSRLKALAENEDGFKLAERDLQLRGPGQFFGTAQSGLPDLAMASLKDTELIEEVQQAVGMFFEKAALDDYPLLKEKLANFTKEIHWE